MSGSYDLLVATLKQGGAAPQSRLGTCFEAGAGLATSPTRRTEAR